ncbi:hypothetical protein DV738_g4477, partial [Chaetothyriales sp. CBS 135597]
MSLIRRDLISEAQSVPQTFSSWDNCMAKAYCKWPAIVGIIIGSLILLSVLFCLVQCDYSQMPPSPYGGYQPPVAQMAWANAGPTTATFDASKKITADSLPAMPSWDTARTRRVEDLSEHEHRQGDEVEMGQLGPQQTGYLSRDGYSQVPNDTPRSPGLPGYSQQGPTGPSMHAYGSDLGAQRMNQGGNYRSGFDQQPAPPATTYHSYPAPPTTDRVGGASDSRYYSRGPSAQSPSYAPRPNVSPLYEQSQYNGSYGPQAATTHAMTGARSPHLDQNTAYDNGYDNSTYVSPQSQQPPSLLQVGRKAVPGSMREVKDSTYKGSDRAMSSLGLSSDPHTSSSVFPTYLVPSVPFKYQKSRQASADSTSSTETSFSVGSASTVATSVSTSSNPFTRPLTPVPIFSPSSVILPPDDKLLFGHSSHIHCAKCATDLCLTSQIISKGFTGRHGRAYLVQGSPSYSRSTDTTLPNTYQHKAVPRSLVTGQHTVSDITCAICGSMLGWKYVEAKDEAQKYKVGKYILETKRIRVGVSWEGDEDDAWGGTGVDETTLGQVVPLSQEQLRQLYDGPSPNIEFDSQDEDECEDIFAGVWSPQLALKRRQRRQDRLNKKIALEKENHGRIYDAKGNKEHIDDTPYDDLDPEDDPLPPSDASSDDQESGDDFTGREHYENVGKSKLRRPEQPVLGAKYGGDAVSRASLRAGDDADPLAPVDEDEDDEDPFAVPANRSRGSEDSASDTGSAFSDSENGLDSRSDASEDAEGIISDDESGEDDEEDSLSDESQLDTNTKQAPSRVTSDREKLKQLNKIDASSVAASLARAAKAEAQKGLAIQKQQTIYDRLLDSRIKLQKALTTSNSLVSGEIEISGEEMKEAARKAEAAALSLCSTIDSIRLKLDSTLRQDTIPGTLNGKRQHEPDSAVDLPELWQNFKLVEARALPERQNVLKKWSATTRAASTVSTLDADIINVLESHIAAEEAKLSERGEESALVYTDDIFYQTLLRDLIASRDKSSASAEAVSVLPTKLHPSGSSKKAVDTRASKGRKIRYTVHEKLQNFMAPEDQTTWSEAARHEFFGSLFGQQLLNENGTGAVDEEEEDDRVQKLNLAPDSQPFVNVKPNGFPNIQDPSDALTAIEQAAQGTLPNSAPPSSLLDDDLTSLRLIAFNELFEVFYFTELLQNVTNNVQGYQVWDPIQRQRLISELTAVVAQEELHALNANGALAHFGADPIQPGKYNAGVSDLQSALTLASTFTDLVLGTLQDVIVKLGVNGDAPLSRAIASVVGQEGEQNGYYRSLLGKLPSSLPFLTASTREFAFSALNQNNVVPGSSPNSHTIDLPIFGALNQNNPIVQDISGANNTNGIITFSAPFPYSANELNGLTIAALTKGSGPFGDVNDVAKATVYGPGLILVN